MNRETAVELLVDAIRGHIAEGTLDAITISRAKMIAKAMEREQIIDAALELICNEYQLEVATQDLIDSAEKYYNETYNGGKHE